MSCISGYAMIQDDHSGSCGLISWWAWSVMLCNCFRYFGKIAGEFRPFNYWLSYHICYGCLCSGDSLLLKWWSNEVMITTVSMSLYLNDMSYWKQNLGSWWKN